MNREDIIRMAREAGFWLDGANQSMPMWVIKQEELERFATLVAEHEREACAKVCDGYSDGRHANMADLCADAIRARDKQDTQCKHCTDGCPACDARKLPKEAYDLF